MSQQPSSTLIKADISRIISDPGRDWIYLSAHEWGTVVVWNTTSDTMVANVSVGSGPLGMDLSWNGDELYVGLTRASALAVVNLSSMSVSKTIPLNVVPVDVAGGRPGRAYVTTTEGWGYPRIVDTEVGKVIGSITAAGVIYQDSLARTSPDRSALLVAEAGLSPATIYAFNVTTDSVPLTSTSPWDSVGENLMDIAVSPVNPWIFIASGWPYYVQVVNYVTWKSVGSLNTGPYPSAVGLAQRGALAFADHESNDVMAFYASNGTRRGTFTFSQQPTVVRGSNDGTKVYAITTDLYGGNRQVERLATGFAASSNEPPVAFALTNRTFGYAPASFGFAGGASLGRWPYSFAWDFGDGTNASGWYVEHTFDKPGINLVKLTVTDAVGVEASFTIAAFVITPPLDNLLTAGAVLPGATFTFPTNFVVPPDPQVAVGPDHIVEMVNLRTVVWSRAGIQLVDDPISSVFGKPAGEFLSDPRIEYDQPTGRWFASILDVNDSSALLAVSNGTDPTSGWMRYRLPAQGCPDQPMLGVGPLTVVVSANVFTSCVGAGSYSGAQYWVVNKTDLLTNRPPQIESFGPYDYLKSLHPVQIVGTAGDMYLVSVGWAELPTPFLRVIRVDGAPPNASKGQELDLPIATVNQPPNVHQLGTSLQVNTGDSRVLDAIETDGKLWLTFGAACQPAGPSSNQSCVRVIEVDPTQQIVLQDFDIGDPVRGYFYPSLRLDNAGNLVVVFGYSSDSDYPGIMVAAQLAGDPLNTTRAPLTLHAGAGPEDLWCPDYISCRYGDYFGASNDPTDPQAIWVVGERGGPSGWQTTVASVGVFKQAYVTLRYTVVGSRLPPSAPTVTYYSRGQQFSSPLTMPYQTFSMDVGTPWKVQSDFAGTPDRERWITEGPTSGTATGPDTRSIDYLHQYFITLKSDEAGGGAVSPGSDWFTEGTSLHVSADAAPGWRFAGWIGEGNGSLSGGSANESFSISGPIVETARFNPGTTLVASPGGSISYYYANVSGVVGSGTAATIYVPVGTDIQLFAQPDLGSRFSGWSGEVTGAGAIAKLSVKTPTTTSADFATDWGVWTAAVGLPAAGTVIGLLAVAVRRRRRRNKRADSPDSRTKEPPST